MNIFQLNLWIALGGSGAKCDMGFFYSMICTRKTRLVPPERSVKAKIALVTTFHITVYITSDSKKFEPHIKAYLSISLDRIIVLLLLYTSFERSWHEKFAILN